MSKQMTVSNDAYVVLAAQKQPNESFSDVILRLSPLAIETCGDLLETLAVDQAPCFKPQFLKELRKRKLSLKRSNRK